MAQAVRAGDSRGFATLASMGLGVEAIDWRALQRGKPPVLLVGGLNLVRALGLARIPVIVAWPESSAPALASRYCRGWLPLPPLSEPQAAAEALARAGERLAEVFGRRVPLFYGSDDGLDLVLRHRELLGSRFRLALNDPEVAAALIDKQRFEALGRARGLPLPAELAWDALAAHPGAVLAKPKSKVAWEGSPAHLRFFGRGGKARIFESGAELAANPLARELRDELLLQEYVAGSDRDLWSFHGFCDERGRLLAWFVGRKIRTWPALTGVSTYLELAHDEELAALGRAVALRLPLRGVFKMDFKRDSRSGQIRLLEVNARYNLWHYLGARNGVNLPQVAYEYLVHGLRPAPARARHRVRHRWLSARLDWRAFRDLASRGELGFWRWIASLAAPKVYDVFAWTDPAPLARSAATRLKRVPRASLRLWRWLSTAS